ncbi:lantibiotic dehydratase [Streptomyces sp. NPDC097617]|uniref:lantibiotic dehydratase n=1 Tax=Streptomyces sp. NPDC097617 TaxID=3366091 RepID=UPI0038230612
MKRTPVWSRTDAVLLRAAAQAAPATPGTGWPAVDNMEECRHWLAAVWAEPVFRAAVRAASAPLADAVEALLRGREYTDRQVRRVTASAARYALRATGRPTPFGLFAGVTSARSGPAAARFGDGHQVVAAADTLWLDTIRQDLCGRSEVLECLTFQVSNLTVRHGRELRRTLAGGQEVRLRLTGPLDAVFALAHAPVSFTQIADRLAALGGTPERISRLVGEAVAKGFLLSNLSAPMTETDPLGHLLDVLTPHAARLAADTRRLLDDLRAIHDLLAQHAAERDPAAASGLRDALTVRMVSLGGASRSQLSTGVLLDAAVSVPESVLDEAVRAADVLVRLTRNRHQRPEWAAYHGMFWERYGAGTLVPVKDAANLAAGVGLPSSFPGSLWPEPQVRILPRDEALAAMAMKALAEGGTALTLTDDDVAMLAIDGDDLAPTPHAELGVRVFATSTEAVDRGDFSLTVHPVWSVGCLTGRFAASLPDSGLPGLYASLPTLVAGALPVQLSFTPVHPHAQNVARVPAHLPHLISVDEHRGPAENVLDLDDLALTSTGTHLFLVSLSRRQVVEPVVLHALALEKQAPPLARLLALATRSSATAWTRFDWGPVASTLPYLPEVRYRRTVISPARWTLPASALPDGPFDHAWRHALEAWAKTWGTPTAVELREGDRTLRLDLEVPLHQQILHTHLRRHARVDLLRARHPGEEAWIGYAHEFIVPLVSNRPPLEHPDLTHAPIVTNTAVSEHGTGAGQEWAQARLVTHPTVMDQILTQRLPGLLAELGDPDSWFVRYRSPTQEDHLRLRIHATGTTRHRITDAVSRWAAALARDGQASHLVFDAYRPEWGRYGTGETMAAAEAVFTADSDMARRILEQPPGVDLRVLCAFGMLDIARGLLGTGPGTEWLATTPAHRRGIPTVTRQAADHVRQHGAGLWPEGSPLAEALTTRRRALSVYRERLATDQLPRVLESLLHMHHNRLLGLDRDGEAACRHAARQLARTLQHHRNAP